MALLFSNEIAPLPLSVRSQRTKPPCLELKKPNTPPRAHLLQRAFSVQKSLPGMSCHREQLCTVQALWLPAAVVGTQTQRAVTYHVGSRVTPDMALSPPSHPVTAPHHHTTPALPIGQAAVRMSAHWWPPFSTSSKRARGDNNTQRHGTVLTWLCRQRLFLSQKLFSSGIQTALTGRFALSATEWGLLRPPEEGRRRVF